MKKVESIPVMTESLWAASIEKSENNFALYSSSTKVMVNVVNDYFTLYLPLNKIFKTTHSHIDWHDEKTLNFIHFMNINTKA